MIGWVFFRAESLGQALTIIQPMFVLDFEGISPEYGFDISNWALAMLGTGVLIVVIQGLRQHSQRLDLFLSLPTISRVGLLLKLPIFLLALTSLIASSYSPFLYFQF